MAPFRSAGRSNRSGRLGASELDLFVEGLPVRQWRQTEGTFGLPPPKEAPRDKDAVFPELPMPRDSDMLQAFTQHLLREARKPRVAKRKAEQSEDQKTDDRPDDAPQLPQVKESKVQSGWNAKKWSHVPTQLEENRWDFLAKRRKGLASSYSEAVVFVPQVATRTAKVRRTDASGNSVIYEVIVPEHQAIEGEIKDADVTMADAPTLLPGTVIEGIGVANAEGQVVVHDLLPPPPKKRNKPPPPKRKGGPGRGKKKVMFQPNPAGGPAGSGVRPVAGPGEATDGTTTPADGAVGTPAEGEGDDEEGDEGEDGEEGEDDGEGEGEGDDDREEGEVSDTDDATGPIDTTDIAMSDAPIAEDVPPRLPEVEATVDTNVDAADIDKTIEDAAQEPPAALTNQPARSATEPPPPPAPTPAVPAAIDTESKVAPPPAPLTIDDPVPAALPPVIEAPPPVLPGLTTLPATAPPPEVLALPGLTPAIPQGDAPLAVDTAASTSGPEAPAAEPVLADAAAPPHPSADSAQQGDQ